MVIVKKMRILQICNFSSGISGVWTRVLEDGREFIKKGHEVRVYSSDVDETGVKVNAEEELEGIKIKRFPIKRKIGYAVWFDFEDEALKFLPDIIICHGIRKPYLGPAVKVARMIKAKCFLITHAPFIEKELRSFKLNSLISLYDKFYGKKIMNSFDKVIAICKWERKNLLKLGCDEERIVYIPNSLSEDFFLERNNINNIKERKILFMGRMHPVKKIEDLINAFKKSKLDEAMYHLEIVSSNEGDYYESLLKLKSEGISFTKPIYDIKEKIKKIDSSEIFALVSKKESLPFGIIEAMARGKIVVATKTLGGVEIIENGKNGFLVEISDEKDLIETFNLISKLVPHQTEKISMAAKQKAEEFRISNVMKKWEELFK